MNKTLTVAKYEFKKTIRRKAYLFVTLILPLLLVAAVFFAMPFIPSLLGNLGGITGFEEKDIGYVDSLGFLEPYGDVIEFKSEESARAALEQENISSYFTLPENYPDNNNITLYTTGTIEFSEPWGEISGFLRINLAGYWNLSDQEASLIIRPFNAEVVKIDAGGAIGSSAGGFLEFFLPYGFAILLLMTIMMSSSYLLQGIGEEKENRTGELLLSSVSADQLLRGKILAYGSLGVLQGIMFAVAGILVIFISPLAPFFTGVEITGMIGLGALYFLLGYALFASSMAATASISSSAKEAQQTSTIFIIMGVIPMALITMIVRDPSSPIALVLTYIPYTSPFIIMMRMSLTTVPLFEIVASLIILIISIFVASKVAGKIFKMGMLKYGKRASLKEVFGFLREK
jgi:ABC-2 type transport system permease protein